MDVSIIIPCYNSGAYLPDALTSISTASFHGTLEVIIVDDGSTDATTLSFLQQLDTTRYRIIYQENKGPAGARNTAVRHATGKYLFFLDSDNKIRPEYLKKGMAFLDADSKVGVAYGNVAFFGVNDEPRFNPQPFSLPRLLVGNYIDMCAMVRRDAWEQVGGFDESRVVMGHEDWDLWLRIAAKDWKFYYIDEVLFDYRNLSNSLIATTYNDESFKITRTHIYSKLIGKGIFRMMDKIHELLPYYWLFFKLDKSSFFRKMFQKFKKS